jgi:thioredoxin-like negative regulator of GroEL
MFTSAMIGLGLLAAGVAFVALRKEFSSKPEKTPKVGGTPVNDVTALNLREMLTQSPAPVVVQFYSNECPACHNQKPNFQEAADTHKGNARFVLINVKENKSTSRRLGITRIPTTMVFQGSDETPLSSRVGVFPAAEVNAFIAEALKR